jgi:hypothetical protein
MRVVLRVVIGFILAGIVGVAVVPLLVLRNLNSGGSGWGLCESQRECANSYFAGFELVAALLLALFILLGLLHVARKALRWSEHRYDVRRSAGGTVGPPEPGLLDWPVRLVRGGRARTWER